MTAWGQAWYQVWLTAIGFGFVIIVLSIAIICLLAEMNYQKKKPLAGKHKGQK